MHRKYNKFLIVSFVSLSIFGVYSYFYNDLKSEAATSDSSLSSSLNNDSDTGTTSATGSDKTAEDTAFLMKLASLKRINIDISLFSNQAFQILRDNNIKLEPLPYGRTNPFSSIQDNVVIVNTASPIKTTSATLISDKSAVLNGAIEGSSSDNIYFEYGINQTPDKTTPKVIPSLIGNFASNINGLSPKTTYYFRSASNINGKLYFGEVMTFNTN